MKINMYFSNVSEKLLDRNVAVLLLGLYEVGGCSGEASAMGSR